MQVDQAVKIVVAALAKERGHPVVSDEELARDVVTALFALKVLDRNRTPLGL